MEAKQVRIIPTNSLLKANECSDGVIYVEDTYARPLMFISGENVGYNVVDTITNAPPKGFRIGVYLDSGQMEGFSSHCARFRAIGTIECF